MVIHSKLEQLDLDHKRVFLRADLNVPLEHGVITGDFRLRELQPTLDLLVHKKARIILATHIGRPHGVYNPALSTRIIAQWLVQAGYQAQFEPNIAQARERSCMLAPGSILVLENMRFFAGEQVHDGIQDREFAQKLKELGDLYVNDAFGLLHRDDTSITLLPALYGAECKTIGLLIAKELEGLYHITHNAEQPFVVIIGGGKVKDKLPFIEALLDIAQVVLLCPALAFTFLRALNKPVGLSLVEPAMIDHARTILSSARYKGVSIMFPDDYYITRKDINGPLEYCTAQAFPDDGIGITIGPHTLERYSKEIQRAKTVFLNGSMGFLERPETMEPLYTLLHTVAQSNAYSVIGGGESVTAVYQQGLEKAVTFCSTGGGATLAYITHTPLPGLAYM